MNYIVKILVILKKYKSRFIKLQFGGGGVFFQTTQCECYNSENRLMFFLNRRSEVFTREENGLVSKR